MINEDFEDFINTGGLKHFPFGITKSKVLELLGNSSEDFNNAESSMVRYDRTEFYFYHPNPDEGLLDGIVILPFSIADEGNLEMDYRWLNEELNYEQVKKRLVENKVDFEETTHNSNDKIMKTKKGVIFFFFEEDMKINKVGRFVNPKDLKNTSSNTGYPQAGS